MNSNVLSKLNISHNQIEEVHEIPCMNTLRVLDLRDNHLNIVTTQILSLPKLTVLHEFITTNQL